MTENPTDIADDLPSYTTIANCASRTGIPEPVIRLAKRNGCTAFAHSRIKLGPLLRWIFAQREDAVDWGTELKKAQAKRERLKLAVDERTVIERSEVKEAISRGTTILFSTMDREFSVVLPPALKGLDETEIQKTLLRGVDGFKEKFKSALGELGRNGEVKP